MRLCYVIFSVALLSSDTVSRPTEVEEDLPQRNSAVYTDFAKKVREQIAVPFYRFIGYRQPVSRGQPSNETWGKVELVDEQLSQEDQKIGIPGVVDHGLQKTREREQLPFEILLRRTGNKRKPAKIFQYLSKDIRNTNISDQISELDFSDVDFEKKSLFDTDYVSDPHQKATIGGTLYSYAETFAGMMELVWGGFKVWLKTKLSALKKRG